MKILPAIFSVLFFGLIGCQAPKKPIVDICNIDAPEYEGVCAKTVSNPEAYRVPIEDMDKFTCFSPDDWEAIKNYMDLMARIIERGARDRR